MKKKILPLICFFVFGILSNVYAASYWVVQTRTQRLLHIQKDANNVTIVESYPIIDPKADYVVNPKNNTCWITSAFQGQVICYGKATPFVVSSFGAPMSLALDVKRQILWVADGALNQIVKMRLDGTIEKRVQINTSSRSIASRADGGLWIATSYGLILLNSDGEVVKEFEQTTKHLSGVPGENSVWLANPVDNHIMHLDGDGNILTEGRLKTLSGLIAVKDGDCVLLGRDSVFQLDADGELVGTLSGLDSPSHIVYQPVDETIWVLQSRGKQLVQLPKEIEQGPLTVIAGLERDNLRVEAADNIKWVSKARRPKVEKPKVEKPKAEKPKEERPKVEKPKVEKPKPEKPKVEKPKAEKPPEKIKPEKKDITKPKPEPEKKESAVKPVKPGTLQKPEAMPKPSVVPAPPVSSLLSGPPMYKDGGVLLATVYEGLSTKRLKKAPQALVRRYVWNFENETFTLLLGLSVEAYNSYTNRDRAKWVEMLAEGVNVAKPIAEEFRKISEKNNWTTEQTANFVLSFVQCLPYTVDNVSTGVDEFPRYATETLVAGGGDCEDTTILAGGIFLVLGYDLVCLNPEGHLAIGVKGKFPGFYFEHNRKRYHYSETTGTGWKIGDIPDIYKNVSVTIYEIPKKK